jgi:hypothetical protein
VSGERRDAAPDDVSGLPALSRHELTGPVGRHRRARPQRREDDLEAVDQFDDDGDELEASDRDDVEPAPVERRRALRQPAAATMMTVDVAPSWWTTASRDGFSRRAGIEHKRMRGSKEAGQVGLRLLQ